MDYGSDVPIGMILLLLGLPAALASYVLCWLMRAVSPRIGYVDHPRGRKAHERVMPMGGGVAVVVTMIVLIGGGLAVAVGRVYEHWSQLAWLAEHHEGIIERANQIAGILVCALTLHMLGLFDDVKDLGPFLKLTVQIAVAALAVLGFGVRVFLFIPAAPVSAVLSILWIVVITNAFNFLDNADGLSSGLALICTSVLLAVATTAGQVFVAAYLCCLAGAILGFLIHNFPPARIFLGDAGSLPVGFLVAVGSILTTYYHEGDPDQARTAALVPLVVMAVPLYDFVSVVFLRLRLGISPLKGDHRHFSHRLIRKGLSVRAAVLTIYLACAGTAVAAIVLRSVSWPFAILLYAQTVCIVGIIALLEYQPANEIKND